MIIKNFLLLFGVSLFGLAIVDRTARGSDLNRITGIKNAEQALSFLGILFQVVLFALFPTRFLYSLMWAPLFLFLSFIFKKFILERRNSQFRSEFERFIDTAILEMRTGASFRVSLDKARHRSPCPFFKERIHILLQNMAFAAPDQTDNLPKNIANLFSRMIEIDSFSHRQIHRLVTFRKQLRLESEFRHKSGQATRQAKAQAWILIGLYIALLLFVLGHFRFEDTSRLIGVSGLFMFMGVVIMRRMGQKNKWKV
jgi:Flp pilus assembly protein TadB